MFCPKCGKTISDKSVFCQFCGSDIKDMLVATQPRVAAPVEVPAERTVPTRKFCRYCGAKLTPKGRFCKNCGSQLL